MGGVYRRKKRMPDGALVPVGPWWIRYSRSGKEFRETARTEIQADARNLLRLREGDIARGIRVDPRQYRVTVGELLDDFLTDYEINKRKSLRIVKLYVENELRPRFGHWRAASLIKDTINAFVLEKLKEGYKRATINNWLAALNRSLVLGIESGRIARKPIIKRIRDNNARQGFFEYDQYQSLRKHLPDHLKPLFEVAYITGWRKSELLSRQWKHVDLEAGTIRLEPGETKNGHGRTFPFFPQLRAVLTAQRALTQAMQQTQGSIIPWVFHKHGQKIVTYDTAWRKARLAAGLPDRIAHDFRRTAIRNLIRAGVSESVAMKLSGHETRCIFDRYAIVSERDLRDAVNMLDQYNVGTLK